MQRRIQNEKERERERKNYLVECEWRGGRLNAEARIQAVCIIVLQPASILPIHHFYRITLSTCAANFNNFFSF